MAKLPKDMEFKVAAPCMCAGISTYGGILRANGSIGIVGIGGLGWKWQEWNCYGRGESTYAQSQVRQLINFLAMLDFALKSAPQPNLKTSPSLNNTEKCIASESIQPVYDGLIIPIIYPGKKEKEKESRTSKYPRSILQSDPAIR